MPLPDPSTLEMWASPETTIARITGERYRDQRIETGHYFREHDIDRLADLGIGATRYPVLWESVAPERPDELDFRWEASRLRLLRKRRVEPIVTLLHHGSGPRYTSLLDARFPELFAAYAASVAREFPWIRRWTPLNEPLTTARFSTLYGVWYPNLRTDVAFGHALVNEMHAHLLAVRAIRRIVPEAEFLLTEDLQGFVAADAGAAAYAAHKRERSYLSLDLACGRVDRAHALWEYLTQRCNVAPARLEAIRRLAQPPDLLGWNYYPYSERVLSSREDGFCDNIALVEARTQPLDPRPLLRAAWQRFRLPMALSEVHALGNEKDRARWLLKRYEDVVALRSEGIAIRAFGAWAAFGMVDWTSLLRADEGYREDGLFTCEPDGEPGPTRAAEVFRALCRGEIPPAAPDSEPGWWETATAATPT